MDRVECSNKLAVVAIVNSEEPEPEDGKEAVTDPG